MHELLTSPTFWGFVLNALGLVVGFVGIALAVNSNRKLRSAREATKATQDKLFRHMAAEAFAEIARLGVEVVQTLRARNWTAATESATSLRLSLGETFGEWSRYIRDNEDRNALDAARRNADLLLGALPVGEQQDQINDERLQQMIGWIQLIINASVEITGRLRIEHLRESKEEQ